MTFCRIVKEIRRPKTAIENIIKCGIDSSGQKRSGEETKLSQRDRRRIIQLATLEKIAAKNSCHFESKVSRRTIIQVLKKLQNMSK